MADGSGEQAAWVKRVLGLDLPAGAGQADEAARDGAAVRLAKGMLLWNETRGHVARQVKALQGAIRQKTANEPDAREIEENLVNLEEILEVLDDRLTGKLNEMRGSADAAAKRKMSAEARDIVAGYQAYVAHDELVNDIDDNGFMTLDIKSRVTKTLAAVLQTI